jgi:type II restriction enzyme
MTYYNKIRELAKNLPSSIVDFSIRRDRTSPPTQASSNFITNKEQGDWAENLIFEAINNSSDNYIAIKYGKSDDLVAGEQGFDKFYNDFQDELDRIGKRPDLLIFRKKDYNARFGQDISGMDESEISDYVKQAIAGLEVRSSAFLIEKYQAEMSKRTNYCISKILSIKNMLLTEFDDILSCKKYQKYKTILESITEETIDSISFRRPSWHANSRLDKISEFFKEMKDLIKIVQKRSYLSITPKVEDLKVVYKWIETYNVPHYYIQVFFDKSYGISFKEIFELLTDPDKESDFYEISKDVKNQNKTTIKINTSKTKQIAYKVDEPEHRSVRREMGRGRLLFYVKFENGTAYLDLDNLKSLLNIQDF